MKSSQSPVGRILMEKAEELLKSLDIDRVFPVGSPRGDEREAGLAEVLSDFLPAKSAIVQQAYIQASNTQTSQEQDIAIYDHLNSPLIYKGKTHLVLPIESIFAVIQVKTRLDRTALGKAISNIQSVKCLPKLRGELVIVEGFKARGQTPGPLGIVFGYEHDFKDTETLVDAVVGLHKSLPHDQTTDLIVTLDPPCLAFHLSGESLRKVALLPAPHRRLVCTARPNAFPLFVSFLTAHIARSPTVLPNLSAYLTEEYSGMRFEYIEPKDYLGMRRAKSPK